MSPQQYRFVVRQKRCRSVTLASAALLLALLGADVSQAAGEQSTDSGQVASCFAPASDGNAGTVGRKYLLSPGDQLQITIYQREDLSGTHEIGEDGMISLPLLGQVHASGRSLSEMEIQIARLTDQTTGRNEHVSIQLPVRRPIYVLGLVNRPGAYPFATDMMILHAVALGGGLFRPDAGAGGLVGVSRENGRLSESTLRLKQNLALRARLEAELDAKPDLEPPRQLVKLEGKDGAQQFISRQIQIMQKRAEVRKKQIISLRETAKLTKQEIKSLAEREGFIVDQIKLALEELKAANSLRKKGLLRRADLFTINRVIAGLESDRRAVQARTVAARRNLLETEGRINLFDISQELALEQEINQAEINIASTETAIRSSQWIVGELGNATSQSDEGAKPLAPGYQVIRSTGNRRHQFQAEELTPLCPGDIVRVQPGSFE
ncbi:MAG: hypothetical protein HKN11_12110 [Rhizobiales bacterium]|nr:hypothetical protein [Hyphomicrobiales bacterium]